MGAIEALVYCYAEAIDAGDFAGLAKLFERGEITVDGDVPPVRGSAAVQKLYEHTTRIYPETGTPRTKHQCTNLVVDVDEAAGIATARSYYTVLQQTPSLSLQPIIAGRYRDEFARSDDGEWHFTRRHIVVDLVGDISQHLLIDLPEPEKES
ncbi:MAG TPA: nuclear transport factor 2 family protein [Acidimicrobiales bacterium]|nr:nuclear transport factor 2 family protein [Acidimicrobiales bacterium]